MDSKIFSNQNGDLSRNILSEWNICLSALVLLCTKSPDVGDQDSSQFSVFFLSSWLSLGKAFFVSIFSDNSDTTTDYTGTPEKKNTTSYSRILYKKKKEKPENKL